MDRRNGRYMIFQKKQEGQCSDCTDKAGGTRGRNRNMELRMSKTTRQSLPGGMEADCFTLIVAQAEEATVHRLRRLGVSV